MADPEKRNAGAQGSEWPHLPLTVAHWGAYRVEVDDGRVVALHDFEHDPCPSPIGRGIVDVLDGPTRITEPMIRRGWLEGGPGARTDRRGADEFIAVSWDRAEKLVADEISRVRADFGNAAIYGGSYGWANAGRFHHAPSQLHRFLNCAGGYTRSVDTYSFAAGQAIIPHVLGGGFRRYLYRGPRWSSIIDNAELIVAFGGIALKNSQIGQGGLGQHIQQPSLMAAIDAGVQFVSISPSAHDLIDQAGGQWLPIRPSTDVALMLGLAYTILDEGLHDIEQLDRLTVGFDRFAQYLRGGTDGVAKTPEWAATITEIAADDIRDLARRMADRPTMISVSWSLTRTDHGEQPFWAAVALAAMLGQLDRPGCGLAFGLGAVNTVGNNHTSLPVAALPQGHNSVDSFIPVARISDMLLNPGASFSYNGADHVYPNIKMVYWAGGNPWHHHQDLNRLLRAWRRPDTVVVHEWCWNANAKHADIVLPCATTLERDDLYMAPGDGFMTIARAAVPPPPGVRTDHAIFRAIAHRLGVQQAFTEGRSPQEWIEWLYQETRRRSLAVGVELPTLGELEAMEWFEVEREDQPVAALDKFTTDPDLHPLPTPSGRIEIFSETIASFGYDDCQGHPMWYEPIEWLGGDGSPYRLHLISNQPANKLHSHLDHGSVSRADKVDGREVLRLHPVDAMARDINDGDVLRVFNDRGACVAAARLDPRLRPGVVQMPTGAWYNPERPGQVGSLCKHGNPNVLTPDVGTSSLGQGPIAHTCLVEVERFNGEPPTPNPFEPPTILREHSTGRG